MSSERVNEMARREWMDLGFYYDRDDSEKVWRILGTKVGLLKFCNLISTYAANSENDVISHHENFGPYSYLEIGTWNVPEITEHWIAGPLKQLMALASDIGVLVPNSVVGQKLLFRHKFSPQSSYELLLEIKDDDFSPITEDPTL